MQTPPITQSFFAEYLIKRFADLTNKKAGEYYTPRSLVRLLGLIPDPHKGETIYDPACGTGGMLLECIGRLKENVFNLNIPLYVEKSIEDNLPCVEEALSDLKTAWDASLKAEEKFKAILINYI
jgi:hypothetical protein